MSLLGLSLFGLNDKTSVCLWLGHLSAWLVS